MSRLHHQRDGKEDEHHVGHDVARGHREQLNVSQSTERLRAGDHLVKITKRPTGAQRAEHDGDKSEEQETADPHENELIAAAPDADGDTFQEFRHSQFAQPDVSGVADSRGQDQFRPEAHMLDLLIGKVLPFYVDVVGAVDEDEVDQDHAREQRDQGDQHDPVLAEEHIAPDFAPHDPGQDDGGGERRAPP